MKRNLILTLLILQCAIAACSQNKKVEQETFIIADGSSTTEKLVARADEMCKKEQNCKAAILLYSQALEKSKDSPEIYEKRGMAYYAITDFERAISDFSSAIDLSTEKNANLYFIRGLSKSLLREEDQEGSCKDLREAKRLGWKSNIDGTQDESFEKWFVGYCLEKKPK